MTRVMRLAPSAQRPSLKRARWAGPQHGSSMPRHPVAVKEKPGVNCRSRGASANSRWGDGFGMALEESFGISSGVGQLPSECIRLLAWGLAFGACSSIVSQRGLPAAIKLTGTIKVSSWLRPRSHPSGRWAATTAGASWHRVGLARGARPPRRYSRFARDDGDRNPPPPGQPSGSGRRRGLSREGSSRPKDSPKIFPGEQDLAGL
jgi:hypothetical protein